MIIGRRNKAMGQKPKVHSENGKRFDGLSFSVWLASVIISYCPLYVSMIAYWNEHNTLDSRFWLKCFVEDDILWTAATVLLLCIVNQIVSFQKRRSGDEPKGLIIPSTAVWGIVVFIFSEATWLMLESLQIPDTAIWPIVLGTIALVLTMGFAIPMQINFIKDGE